ncbi:Uu.00g138880.m01.CDS01 [Anthostomella pinea]|uniref:Uu.00g138880.m01.CDS01 n=1 Tax=Anthostomella pinea TaxID=933095 RepID=A0AAI8VQZ8_9PEZI|nr:Uu.00g138880.m01.CDS01 [Anthostomella pinea]
MAIHHWVGYNRYSPLVELYHAFARRVGNVSLEEMNFQRVLDATKRDPRYAEGAVHDPDTSNVRTRGLIGAGSILLRCYVMMLTDFMQLRQKAAHHMTNITLDLSSALEDCVKLIRLAEENKYIRERVEGHIFYVQLVALTRLAHPFSEETPANGSNTTDQLVEQAREHVFLAESLVDYYPTAKHLREDLKLSQGMLQTPPVHDPNKAHERRRAWIATEAMTYGKDTWYTCKNGHPFTAAGRGASDPTSKATTECPECRIPIGGGCDENSENDESEEDLM